MGSRAQGAFQTIKSEGALLPADLLKRVAEGNRELEGLSPESYHLDKSERINEATNGAWTACRDAWQRFQKARAETPESDTGTTTTRERWLLKLFAELGYGRLQTWKAFEIEGKTYAISHGWGSTPILLTSFKYELDRAERGVFRSSPHSLMQELLNRSDDHLWAFVSNGTQLRILRDNVSFTRAAYVEFDLEAMMDGEVYSDFVLLWLLCHQSRVEADKPEQCWLEKWHQAAKQQGTRALDTLRTGVEKAIEALGQGFLAHKANRELRAKLADGTLTTQAYYQQLLRLVYRFIFLFVAEDRDLLLDPQADDNTRQRYTDHYALGRLRRLAEKRRGTRHSDLWQGVRLVLGLLYPGEPRLGLPALGSWLFSADAAKDLNDCELRNDYLLAAVRSLAFTQEGKVLRPVDYKNLGSEELGSVYESLLELHPDVNADAATFDLTAVTGSERKTTGSYYTPSSLINCLLDSALDPVVDDRLKLAANRARSVSDGSTGKMPMPQAQEKALLDLKICDPACGSGHFLIAAANRVAKRLAAIRTGDDEPSPADQRAAFRDVVGHCIYGVDINPMAVELCKVALWLESIDPGRPLSFLEHRIRPGNSLIGATPRLLKEGIPDDAIKPIEGDDKTICSEYKRRNRDERRGQRLFVFEGALPWLKLGNMPQTFAHLDAMSDESLEGVEAKAQRYAQLVQSADYENARLLADAWCAAFVWKKTREFGDAITESVFLRIEANPHDITPWMKQEIQRLRNQYQFFHWHLAFPDVFRVPGEEESPQNQQTGWSGGFDVVLGNPPWEQVQFDPREFFATRAPSIADARHMAERTRRINRLRETHPDLYAAYLAATRRVDGIRHLLHASGRFPLTSYGRLNSAPLFAELCRSLLSSAGRVGMIVPTGIATDSFNQHFFGDLVNSASLAGLLSFENEEFLFPAVHHATKFCLLTMSGRPIENEPVIFTFYARSVTQAHEESRRFTLTAEDITRLNPNTSTCPIFRSSRDAELTKRIYRAVPVLLYKGSGNAGNPWGYEGLLMFMMNTSSDLFRTREELQQQDWKLTGNLFRNDSSCYLPLYEAKMMHQFDHRFGTYEGQTQSQANQSKLPELTAEQHVDADVLAMPQYWIRDVEIQKRLEGRWNKPWLFGWRRISNTTNERTFISTIMPRVGAGDSLFLILTDPDCPGVVLSANFSAFVFDFAARQKMGGTNLNFYIVEQLPVLPPDRYSVNTPWTAGTLLLSWIERRVIELSCTAHDLEPLARESGYDGPPFRWDEERRFLIRCELDAAYFHLYGIERDDVDYIMETFPIVKRKDEARYGEYRTKRVILIIYDEMAEVMAANEAAVAAGQQPTAAYQTRLDPPPGPPADAQGNFLPLPEWRAGQPRPANWPRHIHPPREVTEIERIPALAAAAIERGRAVAYVTLLLHTWRKPAAREALEAGLVLMLNDDIRGKVLAERPATASAGSATGAPSIVRGLDGFLDGLRANGVISFKDIKGEQAIELGPQAVPYDKFPGDDKTKASEAIQAFDILGEARALAYFKEATDATYELV